MTDDAATPGTGPTTPGAPLASDASLAPDAEAEVEAEVEADVEAEVEAEVEAGGDLVRALWAGTGVFVAVSAVAAVAGDPVDKVAAGVDLVLFAVGTVLFAAGYLRAVGRSRHDAVSVAGLWFLSGGVAPPAVARALRLGLAAQVVVAVVTASVRLYTPLAFGVLVPVYGLGITGLWAARHGTFPPRTGSRRSPGG